MELRREEHGGALDGLWSLALGAIAGILLGLQGLDKLSLVASAAIALVATLSWIFDRRSSSWLALAAIGLALGLGSASATASRRSELDTLAKAPTALRLELRLRSGFERQRFGRRALVEILEASHDQRSVPLSGEAWLRLDCEICPADLPKPGATVAILARYTPAKLGGRPTLDVSSASLIEGRQPAAGIDALRQRLDAALQAAAGDSLRRNKAAALASAVLIGRRDRLDLNTRTAYRDAGLAHLLAVSGLHLGLVAGGLWLLGIWIGMSPNARRWFLLLSIPAYTLLSGAALPARRAAAMLCLFLVTTLMSRPVRPMAAVLLAAVALAIYQPEAILGASFQLTFGVTAALVRWTGPLTERLRGPLWLRAAIAVPLIAQLTAAPIAGLHFGRMLPGSLLANLVAPPLTLAILASGTLAMLLQIGLGWLWSGPAALALDLVWIAEKGLFVLAHPRELLVLEAPSPWPWLLAGGLCLALQRRRQVAALGLACWLSLVLATPLVGRLAPAPQPGLHLLPVGEGLSALAVFESGYKVLFDTGRHSDEALRWLRARRIDHLDILVLSHDDADHIGGARRLLSNLSIGTLLVPDWLGSSGPAQLLRKTAQDAEIDTRSLAGGDSLPPLTVLWPPPNAGLSGNAGSLVIRLEIDGLSALLPGDLESEDEWRLLRAADPDLLRADLLIAAHHGSRGANAAMLLGAVDPKLVLIPAGAENRFGHPHDAVLSRLARRPRCWPGRDQTCAALSSPQGWRIGW